jgi:IS1 family transposase
VIAHVKEGCGILNTARLMGIAKGTVLRRIRKIAARLKPPKDFKEGLDYELNELHAWVGGKRDEKTYVSHAIERKTRQVVDFAVGPRSKETIGKLTGKLKELKPHRVHTDKLNLYPGLLEGLHRPGNFGTLRIERKNLALRTNLKRLGRRTICYSRKVAMLCACLAVWFWG